MTAIEALALLWVVTHELLLLACALIILFSLDELFVDAVYLLARLKRWLLSRRHLVAWTVGSLPADRSARFAIFVPAWQEADVIGPMLERLTRTLGYPNYDVFVGTYPNDPATRSAVASVPDRRIRLVTTASPGPTTKADCLNALWAAMQIAEKRNGFRYGAVVLHDAEDVVHPSELDVFAYMVPRKAMVQLPVLPIANRQSRLIANHYCDEFAEAHGKSMVVREALGAALPSAGVACAFRRAEMDAVARERGGAPFDPSAMTEDYELGIRVSRRGGGAFVRLPETGGKATVATREHFPADFESALRQKTRWLVGIAFQGWSNLGWRGSLADRYMFLRDRKPVVNAGVIVGDH